MVKTIPRPMYYMQFVPYKLDGDKSRVQLLNKNGNYVNCETFLICEQQKFGRSTKKQAQALQFFNI